MAEKNNKDREYYRKLSEMARNPQLTNDEVPENLMLLNKLRGHAEWISRPRWSPNGRYLATPSNDHTVRIWHAASGDLRQTLTTGISSLDIVNISMRMRGLTETPRFHDVSWSPSGDKLATASADGIIRIWNFHDGKLLQTVEAHSKKALSVDWSYLNIIASCSEDHSIKFWKIEKNEVVLKDEVSFPKDEPEACFVMTNRWDNKGLILAAGLFDGSIAIIQNGKSTRIKNRRSAVFGITWSKNNKYLIVAHSDGFIDIWSPEKKFKYLHSIQAHQRGAYSVDTLSESELFASKGADNTVKIWEMETWKLLTTIPERTGGWWACGLEFNPLVPVLATLGDIDTSARIWDVSKLIPDHLEKNDPFNENQSQKLKPIDGLKVFLAHISENKSKVRECYASLLSLGFSPWLDEEDILPGQEWRLAIKKAIKYSHVILVFLSKKAVDKTGHFQREIKMAIDYAMDQPEDQIFIIPVLLEDVEIPDSLSKYQWVRLDSSGGLNRLARSLNERANKLGIDLE